jgi:hypothetical protein
MGIAKPIKNLKKKQKKNMLKLLHIPANTETVDGNQSPLHNKLLMANENTLFLVLSSKKNGGDLLCSQTPSLCFENELKNLYIREKRPNSSHKTVGPFIIGLFLEALLNLSPENLAGI